MRTGPATPLGLDPSPCPWIPAPVRNAAESPALRLRPEAGCVSLWQLPSPRPLAGFGWGGGEGGNDNGAGSEGEGESVCEVGGFRSLRFLD